MPETAQLFMTLPGVPLGRKARAKPSSWHGSALPSPAARGDALKKLRIAEGATRPSVRKGRPRDGSVLVAGERGDAFGSFRPNVALREPRGSATYFLDLLREFRIAHKIARKLFCDGFREIVFPRRDVSHAVLGRADSAVPTRRVAHAPRIQSRLR